MHESSDKHSFEELLAQVEGDPLLAAGQNDQTTEGETPVTGDLLGTGLGGLLSNPELLAKIPLLLKTVQNLTEPLPEIQNDRRPDTPVALLCALRPYLGEHRRQALDTMIRVSRLSESLKSWR